MTTVLVLAATKPHDLRDGGYPLCVTEIAGKPLIQHQIEMSAELGDMSLILAIRDEDCRQWHIDDVVRLLSPNASVLRVGEATGGAACTALLAINDINTDEPLLILNGDELLDLDFSAVTREFEAQGYDAGTVVFSSVHPRYSYVRLDADDLVVEAAEKHPISANATVGFYWFRHGSSFVRAAQQMILKGADVNGRYFICPTFNELILEHARIGVHRIAAGQYHPLKSERQIERYESASDAAKLS
jgi:dTDP-glucose pyrophosphorylase